MKSSGHSKGSISRFKLLSYKEQMTRMLNYKVSGVYPFAVVDMNKRRAFRKNAKNYMHIDRKLKVKQTIKKIILDQMKVSN